MSLVTASRNVSRRIRNSWLSKGNNAKIVSLFFQLPLSFYLWRSSLLMFTITFYNSYIIFYLYTLQSIPGKPFFSNPQIWFLTLSITLLYLYVLMHLYSFLHLFKIYKIFTKRNILHGGAQTWEHRVTGSIRDKRQPLKITLLVILIL